MKSSVHRTLFGMLTLSAIGLVVSLWSADIHYRLHTDPSYESVCAVGNLLNCETVAASPFSVIADLPTALLGAVFYLVLGLTSLSGISKKHPEVSGLFPIMTLGAASGSIFLLFISLRSSGTLCPGCIIVHLINFTAAGLSLRAMGSPKNGFEQIRKSSVAVIKNRWSLGQAAGLMALLILAGPLGGLPRYWETAAWVSIDLPHGITDQNLPWIGAEHPAVTIDEFFDYECPACRRSHKKLRLLLTDRSDTIRVVRHDLSRVPCVSEDGAPFKERCITARAAYCVSQQNRFWQLNDALSAVPPAPMFERREQIMDLLNDLGVDENAISNCMDLPETFSHVQSIYDDGITDRGIKSTPTYFIDNRMLKSKELLSLVKSSY